MKTYYDGGPFCWDLVIVESFKYATAFMCCQTWLAPSERGVGERTWKNSGMFERLWACVCVRVCFHWIVELEKQEGRWTRIGLLFFSYFQLIWDLDSVVSVVALTWISFICSGSGCSESVLTLLLWDTVLPFSSSFFYSQQAFFFSVILYLTTPMYWCLQG